LCTPRVADLTYIRTWNGFVYLAFILDCYSRMIVGWQLATHMRAELVLDALEMANGLRRPGAGLIAHSDRGSQPTFNRSSQHWFVDLTVNTHSMLRPASASQASCGAGC
jgi:transposase InsO family protein